MNLSVLDLGLIEYEQAWKLQEKYAVEIAEGKRDATLLLLEHPHVYTFGRKGHAENLLWDEEQLKEKGIAVHWVDRGGDVTYHGPGQLVGYPLIPLGKLDGQSRIPEADYVGYVRKLEKMLIIALARLGAVAGQRSGLTGVWVQADVYSRCPRCRPEDRNKPAKIAAIGVKVDAHGISRHGFALNINPDMSYWDGIVACGLAEYPVVSLADLMNQPPNMNHVKKEIIQAFEEVFGFDMVPVGN
ncbi:MAG: lipoyl(octanoyl) transferase LipB [Anaerolineales bacterium]